MTWLSISTHTCGASRRLTPITFLTRKTKWTLYSPSCFHELLGTLEGPCVETSRSNPRNTPNTLRAMLDSGIFGSVMFPLWERQRGKEEKTAVSRTTSSTSETITANEMEKFSMFKLTPVSGKQALLRVTSSVYFNHNNNEWIYISYSHCSFPYNEQNSTIHAFLNIYNTMVQTLPFSCSSKLFTV